MEVTNRDSRRRPGLDAVVVVAQQGESTRTVPLEAVLPNLAAAMQGP